MSNKSPVQLPSSPPADKDESFVGGVVRASVWLGQEADVRSWWDNRPDVQLTVYAESYENQVRKGDLAQIETEIAM